MAREKVAMPIGFEDEVRSAQDDEGAIWTNFKVLETRTSGSYTMRDCSWGFAGKDDEGDFLRDEEGHVRWYTIKVTLWNEKATDTGNILARLFAYDEGEKGARCRIIFEPKACFGELYNERVWYKHESADKYQVYLSRPMKNKSTREQNALWDALEVKAKEQGLTHTNWINLYDAQPINPFQEQEMMEQDAREKQPVAVGTDDDD